MNVKKIILTTLMVVFLSACGQSEYEKVKLQAEAGNPEAQRQLANLYRKGEVVSKDTEQYLRWLTAASDQGLALAQLELAMAHMPGGLAERDEVEAVRLMGLLVDQEGADSSYLHLGTYSLLMESHFGGDEVSKLRDEMGRMEYLRLSQEASRAISNQRKLARFTAVRYAVCGSLVAGVDPDNAAAWAITARRYAVEGGADPDILIRTTYNRAGEVLVNQIRRSVANQDAFYISRLWEHCEKLAR